jgi:hypothetical protein
VSIDFYAAVDRWPTQIEMQQCMVERSYPIAFKRFPSVSEDGVVNDGILAVVESTDAYLEGEIYPKAGRLSQQDSQSRAEIANMIGATSQQYLLTIRIGSRPSEFVATAYVISGIINCFGGVAYEPQGDTRGKADFADALLAQIPLLKTWTDNAPNQ